jgi:hypothetical protein
LEESKCAPDDPNGRHWRWHIIAAETPEPPGYLADPVTVFVVQAKQVADISQDSVQKTS